jgi:enoyl-CoA hydratase/carnithine racemase
MKGHDITLAIQGALAWITLDRPGAGNAPDPEMAARLRQACQQVGQDDAVRVILVTGAGEQFCVAPAAAPPPLGQGPSGEAGPLATHEQLALGRIAAPVAALEKPVIAVLNGPAVGQGLELALACDLRLACPEARFAMPHVLAGLLPWDGGTQRLPRVVGRARALELLLTGREFDAQEALAMGLVHQVVPRDQLRSHAQEVAEQAAACGPIALRYAKEAVIQGMEMGLLAGLRLEADLNILLHTTQDRAEGIRSFRERWNPRFQGR